MVGIFGYSVTDGVGLVTRRNIANFGFATPSLGHDMARDVRLGVIGSASNEAIPFCMPVGVVITLRLRRKPTFRMVPGAGQNLEIRPVSPRKIASAYSTAGRVRIFPNIDRSE
jgi:hypothetical protein